MHLLDRVASSQPRECEPLGCRPPKTLEQPGLEVKRGRCEQCAALRAPGPHPEAQDPDTQLCPWGPAELPTTTARVSSTHRCRSTGRAVLCRFVPFLPIEGLSHLPKTAWG